MTRNGGAAVDTPAAVETGARIRVSLDVNLDSRTVSSGPAVVRLRRAYISDGRVVFPARFGPTSP